jgi:hypothetical protein
MVLERIGGGMVRLGHSNCSLGLWQDKLLNLELLQPTKASMSQVQRSNVGLSYER